MLRRTPSLWATKVSLKRSTEMEDSENWKLRGAINYPSKLLQLPVNSEADPIYSGIPSSNWKTQRLETALGRDISQHKHHGHHLSRQED
ncbi:hypothetical protein Y1Q_0011622 [Alligator mississippiensis]|uniref:Uncharacterized protein n=1 Tax=Alligator mississippiensis TaxID=8496 RepID=A0A151M0H6_ALLMI|nr:hypothetical protein Y1Q_0011622 [Alligator mississippiensis]